MRILLLPFLSFLALFAQPAAAATSPSLARLEQQLDSIVASKGSDVGIAAIDLQTGEIVSVKGNTPFPMASTVKIAVAALYLSQVEHGRRSLDDHDRRSHGAQLDVADDDPQRQSRDRPLAQGPRRPARAPALARPATASTGYASTATSRGCSPTSATCGTSAIPSTPLAMVELLRKIDRAELINPSSRNYLLDLMAQCQTGKNRIAALLPFGTPVEHKTGTLNGYTSDVGFITLPDGRRIAVAMFARGGADRPRTIAETARVIYDGFRSTVRLADSAPATRRRAETSAPPHRCARKDRTLSGGRAGRALSEAHRLADAR